MAEEDFLISILLRAIDEASPTLAKVAAEIEALKRAAGGDARSGEATPTSQLAQDIADVGTAAQGTEGKVRASRQEWEATGRSVRSVSRDMGEYATNVDKAVAANDGLEKQLDGVAAKLQKQIDLAKQTGAMSPDQQRAVVEYSRELEAGSSKLDQHSGSYQKYIDLAQQAKQVVTDERVAMGQYRDTLRQVSQSRLEDIRASQEQIDAAGSLRDRISEVSSGYEDFMGRIRDGKVDVDGATIGYQQMGRELSSLSRAYPAASQEAVRFAQAARAASDEAVRLTELSAMAGSAGGGGGVTGGEARNLAWGPGHRGWLTLGLPLATFGSLGALAGLGPEHLAMTGIGLAGSAGGAALGGGLLAAGSLGQMAVGAGSEAAVSASSIADIKALYGAYSTLDAAVAQYGKTSTQARQAQQALTQEENSKYGTGLGGTKGVQAEAQVAQNVVGLNAEWDQRTSAARVQFSKLADEILKIAHTYLPMVADAAEKNLGIIADKIKPLIDYIDGPGKKVFDDLENSFAKRLPTAIHAGTQAFELMAKMIDYISNTFDKGGFTERVNEFFTKWNDPANWNKVKKTVDDLVGDFRTWSAFLKELVKDIFQLFSNDAHTGDAIIKTLTTMLDKLHQWETSTAGRADIHNIFEVHRKEVVELLKLLPPLLEGFGRFYSAVAPALTTVFTDFVKAIGDALNALVSFGNHLGPFKTLFNDGILVPLTGFLLMWRRLGSIGAVGGFFVHLKNDAMGLLAVLRDIPAAIKLIAAGENIGGVLSGLKTSFKTGSGAATSATPATEMREAMVTGGGEAAAAIREAFAAGSTEVAGAITGASAEGAGLQAEGIAGAAGNKEAASAFASDAGTAEIVGGSAVLSRLGLGGIASRAAGFLGGAARIAAPIAAAIGGYEIYQGATGAQTTTGAGLGGRLGPVSKYSWETPGNTLEDPFVDATGNVLKNVPLVGGALSWLTGTDNTNKTTVGLQNLQKELKGVSDPAQLSARQLRDLNTQIDALQKMPDLTATQRTGLEALHKELSPINVELKGMLSNWNGLFQGVNTTTSTAGQQAGQTLQTLGSALAISKSRFGDTKQGAMDMGVAFGKAFQTMETNTNLTAPAIARGIAQINTEIQNELGKLGGVNTAAGRAFNRGLGANAIVPGAGVLAPNPTSRPAATLNYGSPFGNAAGSMQQPRSGGRLIHVAEGGYPEVVLTTDPKHAGRQRQLLAQYLQAAPQVARGYAEGGVAMPPWTGPGGEYRDMGVSALGDVISAASSMLGAASSAAGGGGGSISTKGLSGNLTQIVDQISRQKHWSASDWLQVIQMESGGSMTAKNPHSSAYGIAQFIDGPSEYARYGGNVNTLEGQLVAMGNYISERYGTPTAALSHEHSAGWYQEGGWPAGVPSFAAGGFSSSTQPYSAVTNYLSNLNTISAGGQTLTGGQVQGIQPTQADISLGIATIQSGLRDTVTNAAKLTTYLATITASGGVMDQLTTAIQNLFTTISDRITNTALQVANSYSSPTGAVGGGPRLTGRFVRQVRTPVQQDRATLGAYGREYSALGHDQQVTSSAEESAITQLASLLGVHPGTLQNETPLQISRRVDEMQRGTSHHYAATSHETGTGSHRHRVYTAAHTTYSPAAESRRRAQNLLGSYTNLAAQGSTLTDDRAQTLAAMYQQEGTILSDRMTATSDTLGTTGSGLQTRLTDLQNVGGGAEIRGSQSRLTKSILDNANAQVAQYTSVMKQAEKEGNADLAAQAKQQIQQLQSTISTATSTLIQDQFQNVQNTLGTTSSGLQATASNLQTLGTLGQGTAGVTVTQQLVSNANAQIDQYTTLLKQAQAEGNTSMVAQIQQQIQQLQTSVVGYTSQLLQAQVDYFNQESQQTMQHLANQTTLAQVFGTGVQGLPGVGGGLATTIAAQMQMGVLQQTQGALQSQIGQTTGLLGTAEQQGNATLVSQLTTQLDNLNTQLVQNTQAISDQTVAIQTTMVTFTNNMAQFGTGVFGGLGSAVQTMGSLTGGINVPLATQLAQANQGVLQTQQGGLLSELNSSFGVNLTGLANNPTGLISALGGLNTTQMMAGMTQAQQTLFQNLINSLVSNVGAIEQNTVQLQTLNGQLQQPQQFSTTAWQTFRTAFFTGMGGLLPSVASIPQMADGGTVTREGIAHLHPAEVVTPASMVGTGGDTHIHTNITHPVPVFDPVATGHAQAFAWKHAARTR